MRTNHITALLTGIYLLTSIALMWFAWHEWDSYKTTKSDLLNQSRIMELRSNIVHLGKVLTMSARMAAATGDLQWEERYQRFKPKLDAALEEAKRLSPEPYRAKAVSDADMANIKLVAMENQAFDLIRKGQMDDAKSLLFNDEYERQKAIYAQGMVQFVTQVPPFLQLEELRGIIIHLDEVLSMSALMAAATGDLQWEKRYRNAEPILDAAIKDTKALAPDLISSQAASDTDAANIRLVEMENKSFDLVRQGRMNEAKSLLFGNEYKRQKTIYAQGMGDFSAALSDLASRNITKIQNKALKRVAYTFLLIFLLVVAWLLVIRMMTNWVKSLAHAKELGKEITKRKQAENALKQANQELSRNEMRLNEAQKIAKLGHWDWNIQTNELLWSDEIYRIFGLMPQEFGATYEAFMKAVHVEDHGLVNEAVQNALNDRAPYNIEHRVVLPSGEERFVHEQAEISRDDKGVPVRMLGTVHDVTERKRSEQLLKKSYEEIKILKEKEKESIYRATIQGAQHILNNLLNQLKLVQKEIENTPNFSKDVAQQFVEMNDQAARLVSKLSSVQEIEEQGIKDSVDPMHEMLPRDVILDPEAMRQLPDEIKEELLEAALCLDAEVINNISNQVAHYSDDLAETIRKLIADFRFDQLADAIRSSRQEK